MDVTMERYVLCKLIYLEPSFRLEPIKQHASDEVFMPIYEQAQAMGPMQLQKKKGLALLAV